MNAKNSKVIVNLGGKSGRGCNVYWQVGSSATVGKGRQFGGTSNQGIVYKVKP